MKRSVTIGVAMKEPFKNGLIRKFGNPNFDPTLWMIAWDGNEVAGFSQNRFRKGIGWIGTIAVRQPVARKRSWYSTNTSYFWGVLQSRYNNNWFRRGFCQPYRSHSTLRAGRHVCREENLLCMRKNLEKVKVSLFQKTPPNKACTLRVDCFSIFSSTFSLRVFPAPRQNPRPPTRRKRKPL